MLFKLLGLLTFPIFFAIKLIRLPLTIANCITKLGCLVVVLGIPAGIVVLYIYLT